MSDDILFTAYVRGWKAAAAGIEEPYGEAVFTPMSKEETRRAVAAMNAVVPNASERLHAQWARHWAQILRDTAETFEP